MQLVRDCICRARPAAEPNSISPRPTLAGCANIVGKMELVNGFSHEQSASWNRDNFQAWEAMAREWEAFQTPAGPDGQVDDGNDMFTQCLLPQVFQLARWRPGETILDLGAGSGIIARRFAKEGAHVTGLDYSEAMMETGRNHPANKTLKGTITYDYIDLMDYEKMANYMENRRKFNIITISTTLKSLPDLEPIAKALPLMLAKNGRVVVVDLHPAFSKPAGHRGMEIYEDPLTGKQKLSTYIKVPQYLDVKPCKSEAVRGQPEPLWVFHRPFWALIDPFFRNKLVLDAMREPAFEGEPDLTQAQSYHNFQQTPMLLAFRLRHADSNVIDD